MIILIFASLIGGFITIACTWYWLGMYSILIAPLGATIGTVLMGFILACIRKVHDRRMRLVQTRLENRPTARKTTEQIKNY